MIEDYIDELTATLKDNDYNDIANAEQIYRNKHNNILNSGVSEFEAIMGLGDPVEEACKLCGKKYTVTDRLTTNKIHTDDDIIKANSDKPKTKVGVYMTDIFFMAPGTLLCGAGTFAMTFVSLLAAIIGVMYSVKAWTASIFESTSERGIAFILAIGIFIAGILGIFLTVAIYKHIFKGFSSYLTDRKIILKAIESKENTSNKN